MGFNSGFKGLNAICRAQLYVLLKIGYFGKWIRITLRLLKYGPGEGRRRWVEPIV